MWLPASCPRAKNRWSFSAKGTSRSSTASAFASGEANLLVNEGILIVLIAVFIGGGVYAFAKRDLPL